MNEAPVTPCDFAKLHYLNALRWLNLWSVLVYVFGVTVVLFLVAAILLFIRSTWLPGALTTLGTIVSGVGITWVVNQRAAAVDEEREAFRRLKKECGPPGIGFIGVEQQPWLSELRTLASKSLVWHR
jgi:hypothetical protein